MIEDLEERRGERASFRMGTSATLALVALTAAVFAAQNVAEVSSGDSLYPRFALSLEGLKHGYLWQFLTFQFLHLPLREGGIFHLLGNLFVIYLLGPGIEAVVGRRGFLKLYFLSGMLGGALQMAGGVLAPERFGVAVVGASAGAFGLVAAYATLFPHRRLHVFFLPIPVRADVLLALGIAVTLAGLFLPTGRVAHCAHLGGILLGFLFARQAAKRAAHEIATVKSPLKTIPTTD